jgi:hypothetical protein
MIEAILSDWNMDFADIFPFSECDFFDFDFVQDIDPSTSELLDNDRQTGWFEEAETADRLTQEHDVEMQDLRPGEPYQGEFHQFSQNLKSPEPIEGKTVRVQSAEEWERQKMRIQHLYLARGATLKTTMDIMGKEHGFTAR